MRKHYVRFLKRIMKAKERELAGKGTEYIDNLYNTGVIEKDEYDEIILLK